MTYNKETLKNAIVQKLRLNYGCTEQQATDGEMMKACAMVLRDIMAERGVQTREETAREEKRKVHYLSLEFLMGRSLMKNAYQSGAAGRADRRPSASWASGRRTFSTWSRMPVWATAAWAVWPPAIWTA